MLRRADGAGTSISRSCAPTASARNDRVPWSCTPRPAAALAAGTSRHSFPTVPCAQGQLHAPWLILLLSSCPCSSGRQQPPSTQRTKKRPAERWSLWQFVALTVRELCADYSARSFRRRSSSSASWWRLTLPDSVIGMASMNSMCSGRRRLATPMESRYSAMESSVGSTSPV